MVNGFSPRTVEAIIAAVLADACISISVSGVAEIYTLPDPGFTIVTVMLEITPFNPSSVCETAGTSIETVRLNTSCEVVEDIGYANNTT